MGPLSPALLVTGREGDVVTLEGVIFEGVVFFRAEVLDDIMPIVLGFVGRVPVDDAIRSALLTNEVQPKMIKKV